MMTANSEMRDVRARFVIGQLCNNVYLFRTEQNVFQWEWMVLTFDCMFDGIADIDGLRIIGGHQTE